MKKYFILVSYFNFSCGMWPFFCMVVRTRPVPPVYVRPVAPGGNYMWVDGEWIRRGHGLYISPGILGVRPVARYHEYINGHWQQRKNGWYWVPGHWN